MEHKDSTIIYESMFTAMELILADDASWREAMTGLLRYGFYGEQPESGNPLVQAIWIQSLPAMKNAKDRYAKAVANGKKGGRPAQVTTEQIMQLKAEGKTNKEIAGICGCSEKTVEGHITTFNKEQENKETETYTDTYSESDTYSDTETDTERFQGFSGCNDEQKTDIGVSLDIVGAIIGMYKQGKNYDKMKDKIKKDFNQSVSGKQIHYIIDNRDKYENEIEKDKKQKSEEELRRSLLAIEEEHKRELSQAGEVANILQSYGVNVTEEQVKSRYTSDIIDGDIGCWSWHMDNLTAQVERWPIVYKDLEGQRALNAILGDIEDSCVYQSDSHMEYKVSKKLEEDNKVAIKGLLDIFDEEI